MEPEKVQLLEEAMRQFNATSAELEKSYRLLEGQVRQLKDELEIKNKALNESTLEQERLREEAERNKRLAVLGEMSARIAHELRNPLGSIELFASLLSNGLSADAEKQSWAKHIHTAVSAMDYALSNMLLFTKKLTPHLQKTDLKKVIEEATLFARYLLDQKQIHLAQSTDALNEDVYCDEDLMRQIFLNLILNAIDALPQGGQLTIHAITDGKDVQILFSDTGFGMSDEVLSKIFDPFYTTKNKGTGLGLAIVYNAIVAHHGTIDVKSKVGEGTVFTVSLPINPERV
ncbi:MAG: ATP-binding protein [Nitrospirota bacterium]